MNPLVTLPFIGEVWGFFWSSHLQKYHQYINQYKYPLWTEADHGVDTVLQNMTNVRELAQISPVFVSEMRNNGKDRGIPSAAFRTGSSIKISFVKNNICFF